VIGRVRSIFCGSGQAGSAIYGLGLNLKFFSLRVKKNLFGSGQKVPGSKAGRPLIYCRSKVCSGRVGSGQGPSLEESKIRGHHGRMVKGT